jgi:hypothetical protein
MGLVSKLSVISHQLPAKIKTLLGSVAMKPPFLRVIVNSCRPPNGLTLPPMSHFYVNPRHPVKVQSHEKTDTRRTGYGVRFRKISSERPFKKGMFSQLSVISCQLPEKSEIFRPTTLNRGSIKMEAFLGVVVDYPGMGTREGGAYVL